MTDKIRTVPALSARELRSRARVEEADAGRLRTLLVIATAIAGEPRSRDALTTALTPMLGHLGCDAGLVLRAQAGALIVVTGLGEVLPAGARTPLGGVLADILRGPPRPLLRERVVSRLRLGSDPVTGWEWLTPIVVGGQALGLLALLGTRPAPPPDAADQRMLAAAATLLGAALNPSAVAAPRKSTAASHSGLSRLTAREHQVLSLLPSGASNPQIAERLGCAPGTVKIHVERILHKLGVPDRTAAAVIATERGLRA